jgi:YVTN family beta-propeller protein
MNHRRRGAQPIRDTLRAHGRRAISKLALLLSLVVALSLTALPARAIQAASHSDVSVAASLDAYITGLSGPSTFSGTVLVARHGTILLSKGYGMADRAHKVPNSPNTPYQVNGVSTSLAFLGALLLEQQGKLVDAAQICRYLTGCPASWKPTTVHMVLNGTSGLPGFDSGTPGRTFSQSLRLLQDSPLAGKPGSQIGYVDNGESLVLPLITEKISGVSWGAFLQHYVFGPAGMTHSGQLTPASAPPGLAQSYSGSTVASDPAAVSSTSSYFVAYASAPAVYAYDNALFGGKLVDTATMQRLFTPRIPAPAPTAAFGKARYGFWWRTGQVAGHQAVYTVRETTANLRFVQDGVTIVVIGNDVDNVVGDVAAHLAALVFGQSGAGSGAQSVSAAGPPHVIALAKAVLATFKGSGTVANMPGAAAPGALWFPMFSANGYMGSIRRVDTRTGRVVATIKVSAPNVTLPEQGLGDVAIANGQVWAADSGSETLSRIDPATNRVVATIKLGIPADGLAISGTTMWATADPSLGDGIARVDLRTQKVVAVFANAGHPFVENAATPDAFWYVATDSEHVIRVDAATNKIVATINAGTVPQTVFVGFGSVWVGDASGALVSRIDPRTNKVVASISTDGYPGNRKANFDDCACRYAAGEGSVWAIGNSTTLVRIDPQTNRVAASLTFPTRLGSVALSEGSIWLGTDPIFGETGNPPYTIYRVSLPAMLAR